MGVTKTMTECQLRNQERKYAWTPGKYNTQWGKCLQVGKCHSLGSKPSPSPTLTTAELTWLVSVLFFPLTTGSPHRSLNDTLKCNMNLHIHSKASKGFQSHVEENPKLCRGLWRQSWAGSRMLTSSSSATVPKFHNCGDIFHTDLSKSVIRPPPSHPPLSILLLYIPFIAIRHVEYIQSLLVRAVKSCKATEMLSYHTVASGKHRVKFQEASRHSISPPRQYITLFYVFLFKDTLFSVYCWLINIELIANNHLTHAWKELVQYISFSPKAHHSFLELKKTRQYFSTTLKDHWKQKIHLPLKSP